MCLRETALNRMLFLFALWCQLHRTFGCEILPQNRAANARVFIFIPPYAPGVSSIVHGATAWWLLVTYGRCWCLYYTAELPRYLRKWNSASSTIELAKILQPTLMAIRIMLLVSFTNNQANFIF